MPKCHNHSKATYKGTEPSPKGLGYCARAEHEGAEMQGRDGRSWIVQLTKTGSKRWKPLTKQKGQGSVKLNPLSFRMVIGYFRHEQFYEDMGEEDDTRDYATKKSLAAYVKKPEMWNSLDIAVGDLHTIAKWEYNVNIRKITPKNIKKVKVLSAPVHSPTFWEKLTGKHNGWWYKPDLVLVVDVEKVPVIQVSEKEQKWGRQGFKNVDQQFYDDMLHSANHYFHSAEGWINWNKATVKKGEHYATNKEAGPFKGQLRMLQMGPKVMPDYRKFR